MPHTQGNETSSKTFPGIPSIPKVSHVGLQAPMELYRTRRTELLAVQCNRHLKRERFGTKLSPKLHYLEVDCASAARLALSEFVRPSPAVIRSALAAASPGSGCGCLWTNFGRTGFPENFWYFGGNSCRTIGVFEHFFEDEGDWSGLACRVTRLGRHFRLQRALRTRPRSPGALAFRNWLCTSEHGSEDSSTRTAWLV